MTLGDRVRVLRRRRGLTQEVVAHLVGHSERWLRDIETGAVDLRVSDAIRLADALGVEVANLLDDAGDARPQSADQQGGDRANGAGRLSAGHVLHSPPTGDSLRTIDDAAWPDHERLTEAVDGSAIVDVRLTESLSCFARQLFGLWGRVPPSDFRQLAHGLLGTLHALMGHPMPSKLRRELESAGACTATMAGYTSSLVGRPDDAAVYLEIAERLGRDAGDAEGEALALLFSSQLYSRVCPARQATGDPPRAQALLEAADRRLGRTTAPIANAWVLMRAAEEVAGRDEAAAFRLVDEADRLMAGAGPPPADGMCCRWGMGLHVAFRGNISVLAGHPMRGIALLERAVAALPRELVATRPMATADLGGAYAQVGEIEHACTLLGEALGQAKAASLPVPVKRVRSVRAQRLAGYEAVASVRELDEQLTNHAR